MHRIRTDSYIYQRPGAPGDKANHTNATLQIEFSLSTVENTFSLVFVWVSRRAGQVRGTPLLGLLER